MSLAFGASAAEQKTEVSMEYSSSKREIICPFCGSANTEPLALFGQQLLTVQYYCNDCHTPFERIKDDDVLDNYNAEKRKESFEGR